MTFETSRRTFLQGTGALATTALIVGLTPGGALAKAEPTGQHFTPFVKIAADGQVTAIIKHFEMGQGTTTGLTTLIAEELGIDLDDMAYEFAPSDNKLYANLAFGSQGTGGSTAIANSFMQYRQAGAAAREMILAAAAAAWKVDAKQLKLDKGRVSDGKKSAPLSDFVAAAVKLEVPEKPPLKEAKDFKWIGNPDTYRLDSASKINGTAQFAMDIHLDGQMVAVIKRSPRFGGQIVSFDDKEAAKVPGFIRAANLPTKAGVVIFAENTWAAFQAREALEAEWDFSKAENRGSEEIKKSLLKAVNSKPEFNATPGADIKDTAQRLAEAAQVIEKDFYFPYLSHSPMEPLTCTIEPRDDGVVLHDGCQFPAGAHPTLAAVLKLPMEKIQIRTLYAGGSFGRRATPVSDYHAEAAFAFALTDRKKPVKLVWSREDDLIGGYYRPAFAHKVRVGLDKQGNIVAWDHRIAGKSIFKGTRLESALVKDGVDKTSVEGVDDTHYDIPGLYVGLTDHKTQVPVVWWRSVGHSHTAFVMETMIDMAAKAAGRDPLDYRLGLLPGKDDDQKRLAGVLKLVADKAGWKSALPSGRSRGIAVHKSFNSYVAQVVEISRDGDAYRIENVTCAVDCGIAVNPDIIKAQMQSGIGYGLGHVMRNEITLDEGEVQQQNFPDYEPLRIGDIARIDVHIQQSDKAPTGVGEPGLPPSGPALANAIAANGPRVTHLPLITNGVEFA